MTIIIGCDFHSRFQQIAMLSLGLDPLYTIAAVICAVVPTAKTVYILAAEYHFEEMMVASTVSMTTLASIISLVVWLYGLSGLATRIAAR